MDLGPSGPDLELDLTWDLDLSLKIPYISFSHENVTQRKVESSGFLLTEGEHRSLSLLYYVYHKNIGAPNVVCF